MQVWSTGITNKFGESYFILIDKQSNTERIHTQLGEDSFIKALKKERYSLINFQAHYVTEVDMRVRKATHLFVLPPILNYNIDSESAVSIRDRLREEFKQSNISIDISAEYANVEIPEYKVSDEYLQDKYNLHISSSGYGMRIGRKDASVQLTDAELNRILQLQSSNYINIIGADAFRNSGIASIKLGDSITNIQEDAFANNDKLEIVSLGDWCIKLSKNSFKNCVGLSKVDYNSNLKIIGDSCFSGCNFSEELGLPEGLDIIGNQAYSDNKALLRIRFPKSVRDIGEGCLYDCTSLQHVQISKDYLELNHITPDNLRNKLGIRDKATIEVY